MLESLLHDSVERGVIVEAKVTGVNNVVGACLLGQLVERSQVSCDRGDRLSATVLPFVCSPKEGFKAGGGALTSNICNAENSDGTGLDDAAMVGQERCGSWLKARGAVLEVALVVVWSRLAKVSIVAQLQQCLETPILHGSPGQESR